METLLLLDYVLLVLLVVDAVNAERQWRLVGEDFGEGFAVVAW